MQPAAVAHALKQDALLDNEVVWRDCAVEHVVSVGKLAQFGLGPTAMRVFVFFATRLQLLSDIDGQD